MSEENALLSAIAANPAEDTPRLVYADWLDEHDQPIRAEFIRLQIEISHKELLPRVLQNRYVDVWKRNQELIDHHLDELLGPLRGLRSYAKIEFSRGFVSELTLAANNFLAHADIIASLQPLPDVKLWDVAANLGQLADASEHLAIVTSVQMQSPRRSRPVTLNPGQVWSCFFECGPWERLRELDMEVCDIGDEGLRYLAAAHENLSKLAVLDVSGNGITDDGVTELLRSPLPRQLRHLVLGGNPIGDEAAIALAENWPTGNDDKLQELNLRFTEIGPIGQQALLPRFGGRVVLF